MCRFGTITVASLGYIPTPTIQHPPFPVITKRMQYPLAVFDPLTVIESTGKSCDHDTYTSIPRKSLEFVKRQSTTRNDADGGVDGVIE